MSFVIEFFLTIASYQFLKNDSIFIKHDLFFEENIFYNFSGSNFKSKVFSGWNRQNFFFKRNIFIKNN